MKTEKIYTQHEENKEWASNLLFYKDEMKIMENRLAEITSKNTSKEILAQVEHFQNKLIIQKEDNYKIAHEINTNNHTLNHEIEKNITAVDHRSVKDHSVIRDNVKSFESNFITFKAELNTFLSKWM